MGKKSQLLSRVLVFLILLLHASVPALQSQPYEDPAKLSDIDQLREFITKNDINECYKGISPLMNFAYKGNLPFVECLVDSGADIDFVCQKKRTALMYATRHNQIEVARFLVESGADVNRRDFQNHTALQMAKSMGHYKLAMEAFGVPMEDILRPDGPYILKSSNYIVYDIHFNEEGLLQPFRTEIPSREITSKQFSCRDESGKPMFTFRIQKDLKVDKSKYPMPEKLLAISDIEGCFDAFVNLLKRNGVIDEKYNWKYGTGHVVLVGDFFDRGENVLECLWLAYKLDAEAKKSGGKLHFLLGNHEELNLRGELDYVREKYMVNANFMKMEYPEFFKEESVLREWMLTKNSIVKIGEMLFVHGGISPEFMKRRAGLYEINNISRKYIAYDGVVPEEDDLAAAVFNRRYGPLWYRGYVKKRVREEDLDKILKFFKVRHIVVGHTSVSEVSPLYGGRIIAIDVPHAKGPESQQALLVEREQLYMVDVKGNKIALSW